MLRFSTRNNCCEFLAFYGVNTQSIIQSFLKTTVCGASLSHDITILNNAFRSLEGKHNYASELELNRQTPSNSLIADLNNVT